MEIKDLLRGSAEKIGKLARVIKLRASSHAELLSRVCVVEAKASRASSVASKLGVLTRYPSTCTDLFRNTLQNLEEEVQSILSKIDPPTNKTFKSVFHLGATSIIRQLDEVKMQLTKTNYLLHIIYMIGSLVISQRAKATKNMLRIAFSCLAEIGKTKKQIQIYRELGSRLQLFISFIPKFSSVGEEADLAFFMGRTDFEICSGGAVKSGTEPQKLKRAVRYFRKACDLGRKEAFRYLGDIIYDGYDGNGCFSTAAEIYREGVLRNDLPSQFRLGMCYQYGHGVEQSEETAIKLYTDAAGKGCGESMYVVGHQKLHGLMLDTNHTSAFQLIKKAVQLNVEAAKGELGVCYKKGIGCEQDLGKAFELFNEAFNAGSFWDLIDLANCYDTGEGVPKDPTKATELYEECMAVGSWHGNFFKAMYGLRVVQGLGIEKNESRGKALIIDASSEETAYPWYALGECYRNGFGFKLSKALARRCYMKATKKLVGIEAIIGSYEALGQMYENGEGVRVDSDRSCKYYLFAAEKLSRLGQWKSANAFEKGVGLPRDTHRAVYFFKLCAGSGHKGAQRKMMTYYMKGHGIERSRICTRDKITENRKREPRWDA